MAMMGTATASGEERGKAAAMAAIKSPLLEDVDLQGARGVLLNITTSSNVELGELYDVTDTVAEFVSADATVLWGHVIDDEMGDEMRVTMVATGLGAKRKMQAVQGGAAAAPRLEIPTLRTGTDNLGVATEAAPVTAVSRFLLRRADLRTQSGSQHRAFAGNSDLPAQTGRPGPRPCGAAAYAAARRTGGALLAAPARHPHRALPQTCGADSLPVPVG